MPVDIPALTRKEFLFALAAPAILQEARATEHLSGKLLIVVAHPDDEYAFAATTYRLVRELGWAADQVIITNGEAGYRYSTLAQAIYGTALANERDGRVNLPAIRKEEAGRAGKILGIRQHFFLDQKDSGFDSDGPPLLPTIGTAPTFWKFWADCCRVNATMRSSPCSPRRRHTATIAPLPNWCWRQCRGCRRHSAPPSSE